MTNKTFQGRIIQKHDTKANWDKATNFVPLKGEIIVYDDLKKIKIGDGATKVGSLAFINDLDTLAAIAKTGNYNDLKNKPTIPTKLSNLTDDVVSGKYLSLTGGTMTGKLTVPQVETGDGNSNFFQCRKFRGEGNADTYYHAIDFGYKNHDQVDFHEYGGKWNFYKNQSGKVNEGVLCGSITSNGWEGRAKLKSGSTMVTSQLTENSDVIATTAFAHGLVDMGKAVSFTVTLTAAGWSGNAQTVSNSKFITSGYAYTVRPAGDSFAGYAEAVIYADDVTTAGKMTFHCNEAPTENLTVNILRTEVTA